MGAIKNLAITEDRTLTKAELKYVVANSSMPNLDIYRRFPDVAALNLSSTTKEENDSRLPTWTAQQLMYGGLDSSVAWSGSYAMALVMLPIVLMYARYAPTKFAKSIKLKSIILALYLVAESDHPKDILPYGLVDNSVSTYNLFVQLEKFGFNNLAKEFGNFCY